MGEPKASCLLGGAEGDGLMMGEMKHGWFFQVRKHRCVDGRSKLAVFGEGA